MPELPWRKWIPSYWASEPGLRLCRPATRGIWFDALNTMMLSGTYQVSGTQEELCGLLACLPCEISMAIEQLKKHKVGEITEQNGNIIIENRRLKRDFEIRQLRAKAGRISGTKRQHTPQHNPQHGVGTKGGTPSTSTSISTSVEGGAGGSFEPTWEHALKWLADWKTSGADYAEKETKSAFLALQANGWMWGKNPVINFQAALERQIQTDRQRNNHGNPNAKTPNQRVDRSVGTANEGLASKYKNLGRMVQVPNQGKTGA